MTYIFTFNSDGFVQEKTPKFCKYLNDYNLYILNNNILHTVFSLWFHFAHLTVQTDVKLTFPVFPKNEMHLSVYTLDTYCFRQYARALPLMCDYECSDIYRFKVILNKVRIWKNIKCVNVSKFESSFLALDFFIMQTQLGKV